MSRGPGFLFSSKGIYLSIVARNLPTDHMPVKELSQVRSCPEVHDSGCERKFPAIWQLIDVKRFPAWHGGCFRRRA